VSDRRDASLNELRAPAAEHRSLLQQRATALARVERSADTTDTFTGLRFRLGGEEYVVDASCILQVGVLRELAPLPGAPAPLFGVTHWRGTVLTVLDLRTQLGARVGGLTDLSRLVVVDGRTQPFAVLADAVVDMLDVATHSLKPLPERNVARSLLRGMTADGALVIDADALRSVFDAARQATHTRGRGG
jgi:purine-binding chemotaxis protein CheW